MQPGIHEQVDPLRRTDWRFLLPNPLDRPIERLVLLGGPDDLPDLVERSGIAERVSRELPSEAVADAVVLLGASLASLRRAAHGVAPGGSLYAEFDRRSPATCADSPGRVRRALARAGLAPTGTYWIRPDLVRRQVYVPVQSAGPLAWYLRSLFTASSPPERVLEAVLRRLERLGPRAFAACAPCFAVTAVAGPGVGSSPSVVCHDSLPPEARSAGAQILVITQGKEDFKRVTVLPFPASGDQPLVVLKSARSLRHNECTRSEQEILGAIRSALDGAMRASVPEPLGFVQRGHVSVGIESVAPGRSMVSQVNYWGSSLERRIDELRRVAAWLTEFHRRVQLDGASWGEPEQSQWIDGPLADYERAFGAWTGEQKLFAEARRRARAARRGAADGLGALGLQRVQRAHQRARDPRDRLGAGHTRSTAARPALLRHHLEPLGAQSEHPRRQAGRLPPALRPPAAGRPCFRRRARGVRPLPGRARHRPPLLPRAAGRDVREARPDPPAPAGRRARTDRERPPRQPVPRLDRDPR
jgi:hypothetical protein